MEESPYPQDRVIVYRDPFVHEKLIFDYNADRLGYEKYTREAYEKERDQLGVLVLRTNDMEIRREELFAKHRDLQEMEAYCAFLKNGLIVSGPEMEDHYVQQRFGFLTLAEGQIYSAVLKKIREAGDPSVRDMTLMRASASWGA